MFAINQTLFKTYAQGRYNEFVLIPGTPLFPLDSDDKGLIELGESTVMYLRNQKAKINPRVLFLPNHEGIENKPGYNPHKLNTYAEIIKKEKQLSLVFHIAGHSDQNSIGKNLEGGDCYSVNEFVQKLIAYFNESNLLTKLLNHPITFVFHSCNTAYVANAESYDEQQLASIILIESFIGKFATLLQNEGFSNITVKGYRGFFSVLEGKKGICVASDLSSNPEYSVAAATAEFTIHLKTGQPPQVKVPLAVRARTFEVNFPPVNRYQQGASI